METFLSHLPQAVTSSSLASTGTNTMAAAASAASAAAARIGAVLSDAQYFESNMVRPEDIRRQLDSRSLKEKLDAMKRVVALISLGRDASMFFPDVVKNVVAPSLDVKKLVYLYLVHYAEDKQDLALLSINSFQKDLSDHNQLIRALALRVLSSIRVKVILQIVIHAIAKCATDPSPYVRKTAAHAICKVCSLDAPSRETLLEPLALLLNDRSVDVLGSAVAVLEEVAPELFELVHPHFRHLCRSLPSMDPHAQVAVLQLLLRYGRSQFADYTSRSAPRDPDLSLLLSSIQPLCMSRNPSVICSVVSIYYHLGTLEELCACATVPLMRLVSSGEQSVQYVALRIAADVVLRAPGALLPYLSEFFVTIADGVPVRDQKLVVLTRFCETAGHPSGLSAYPQSRRALLVEFRAYLGHVDKSLAAVATRALGCLASAHPPSTSVAIGILASVVAGSSSGVVVSESVTVLRRLLQLNPNSQSRALPKLVALLLVPRHDKTFIEAPQARAAITWLIGEFYDKAPHVAPEALRLLALGFHEESAEVKLQVLNLAVKVLAWQAIGRKSALETKPVSFETRLKLLDYLTSAAMFDKDYDVRDKARLFRHLFVSRTWNPEKVLALSESLFESKKAWVDKEVSQQQGSFHSSCGIALESSNYILASMSHVIGRRLVDCRELPAWAVKDGPSSIRDEDSSHTRSGAGVLDVSGVSCSDIGHHPTSESISHVSVFGNISSSAIGQSIQSGGMSTSGGIGYSSGSLAPAQRAVRISPDHFYESESEEDGSEGSYETDSEDEMPTNANGTKPSSLQRSDHPIVEKEARSPDEADSLLADLLGDTFGKPQPKSGQALTGMLGTGKSPKGADIFALEAHHSAPPPGYAWWRIVDSWNAGGIEVHFRFVRDSFEGGPNASPICLKLSNCGKKSLSDISVKALSQNLVISVPDCVPLLSPRSSMELRGYCLFAGKTLGVPFSVCSGPEVLGSGEIRPTVGQVIRPLSSLTYDEFIVMEKSFGGMFGSRTNFSISVPSDALADTGYALSTVAQVARQQILDAAFLAEVRSVVSGYSYSAGASTNVLFAGYIPSTGSTYIDTGKVLVRCQVVMPVNSASEKPRCPVVLWIGCENVVFASNLLQVIKRALTGNGADRNS